MNAHAHDTLYLHCGACISAEQRGRLAVAVEVGKVIVTCENHPTPLFVVAIPATTDKYLAQGCGGPTCKPAAVSKTYRGVRDEDGDTFVTVEQGGATRELSLRLDLWNHSPTGFEWGYGGSGPAQTALAILADALDDERAVKLHQKFKFDHVARFGTRWAITSEEVIAWAESHDELKAMR